MAKKKSVTPTELQKLRDAFQAGDVGFWEAFAKSFPAATKDPQFRELMELGVMGMAGPTGVGGKVAGAGKWGARLRAMLEGRNLSGVAGAGKAVTTGKGLLSWRNILGAILAYKAGDELVTKPGDQKRQIELMEKEASIAKESAADSSAAQRALLEQEAAALPFERRRAAITKQAELETQMANARIKQNESMLDRVSEAHGPMLQSWQTAMNASGDPLIAAAAQYASSLGVASNSASEAFNAALNR